MIETGYVYLACGFVILAISIKLTTDFSAKDWITEN